MRATHVAHDVVIAEDVTISPNVTIGGHGRIGRGATIGIGACLHQFGTVGGWSMIGMASVVTKDVPPFALVMGSPARFARENTKGVEAARAAGVDRAACMAAFLVDSRRARIDVPAWGTP